MSDVRVISSMATRRLLTDLAAAFARTSPHRLALESVGGVEAAARVAAGEPVDAVVLASGALERLLDEGWIVRGSRVDVAKSPVAMAVRAGAARPPIASEEDVQHAVLSARSIGYSTGPSGDHLGALLDRWGLRAAVRDRMVQAAPGVPVAALLARGDAELGFQQLSEFIDAPGIDVVGVLPEAVQNVTTFAAGIASTSRQRDITAAVLTFLASPLVAEIKRRHGMEPA